MSSGSYSCRNSFPLDTSRESVLRILEISDYFILCGQEQKDKCLFFFFLRAQINPNAKFLLSF